VKCPQRPDGRPNPKCSDLYKLADRGIGGGIAVVTTDAAEVETGTATEIEGTVLGARTGTKAETRRTRRKKRIEKGADRAVRRERGGRMAEMMGERRPKHQGKRQNLTLQQGTVYQVFETCNLLVDGSCMGVLKWF